MEEALKLYQNALEYFLTALKCRCLLALSKFRSTSQSSGQVNSLFSCSMAMEIDEKNERTKDTVRTKVIEYMDRAEKIKDHLIRLEAKPKRKALTGSSNGNGNGGGRSSG